MKSGLLPLKLDRRDYSHHKTFGSASLLELPDEYLSVSTILNQRLTDECTAYAASAVMESQKGIQFSPDWYFAKEKQIIGNPQDYGADLRTAMKVGVKYGFLPQKDAKFTNLEQGRDFIANADNWPFDNDIKAQSYKEYSYFSVDGGYDIFDNIRVALWKARMSKKTALAGIKWYGEFTAAKDGVIPQIYFNPQNLHAIKIAGWKTINGVPHLVVQNSYGEALGDKGLFYFPREVVNKEFKEGVFIWRDYELGLEVKSIGIWVVIRKLLLKFIKLFD